MRRSHRLNESRTIGTRRYDVKNNVTQPSASPGCVTRSAAYAFFMLLPIGREQLLSGFNDDELGNAVYFFGGAPFGPGIGEFRAWMRHGGGQELREALYNAHGVTAIDSFCVGPESSGWFRTEIVSLDQLRGLKMRIFGIGARVWQKMGVSIVELAGSQIIQAFERGEIDAADFAMPAVDINFGFHRVAKYNYYPGWHQPFTCGELLMHKASYDALPDAYKAIIKAAAVEQGSATYAETEGENFAAMRKLRDDHGVNILRWSDEALKRFEAAWIEVVAEESAADPEFKKVADRYFAFRDRYRIWGDAQSLERTYQEDPASSSPRTLPLFLSADDPGKRQGFVRIHQPLRSQRHRGHHRHRRYRPVIRSRLLAAGPDADEAFQLRGPGRREAFERAVAWHRGRRRRLATGVEYDSGHQGSGVYPNRGPFPHQHS